MATCDMISHLNWTRHELIGTTKTAKIGSKIIVDAAGQSSLLKKKNIKREKKN